MLLPRCAPHAVLGRLQKALRFGCRFNVNREAVFFKEGIGLNAGHLGHILKNRGLYGDGGLHLLLGSAGRTKLLCHGSQCRAGSLHALTLTLVPFDRCRGQLVDRKLQFARCVVRSGLTNRHAVSVKARQGHYVFSQGLIFQPQLKYLGKRNLYVGASGLGFREHFSGVRHQLAEFIHVGFCLSGVDNHVRKRRALEDRLHRPSRDIRRTLCEAGRLHSVKSFFDHGGTIEGALCRTLVMRHTADLVACRDHVHGGRGKIRDCFKKDIGSVDLLTDRNLPERFAAGTKRRLHYGLRSVVLHDCTGCLGRAVGGSACVDGLTQSLSGAAGLYSRVKRADRTDAQPSGAKRQRIHRADGERAFRRRDTGFTH